MPSLFSDIQSILPQITVSNNSNFKPPFDIDTYPLINSQAVCTISFDAEGMSCQKGFCKFLGFTSFDLRGQVKLQKLIHPDERQVVSHIVVGAFKFAAKFGMDVSDRLYVSFRIQAGDSYLPVELTSGIYKLTTNGKIKSGFVILRKKPFAGNADPIEFLWESHYSSMKKFQDFIHLRHSYELTFREFEILELVAQGFKNDYISTKLFIETETVRTHKKNSIRKLGFKDSNELMIYYHEKLKGRLTV